MMDVTCIAHHRGAPEAGNCEDGENEKILALTTLHRPLEIFWKAAQRRRFRDFRSQGANIVG